MFKIYFKHALSANHFRYIELTYYLFVVDRIKKDKLVVMVIVFSLAIHPTSKRSFNLSIQNYEIFFQANALLLFAE